MNASEHLENLRALLQHLQDKDLQCRLEKCQLAEPSIEYLGHTLSQKGIAKGSKVDALVPMPPHTNVSSLRSFLGSVQFYSNFLPNLATVLAPLHQLTKKDTKWKWDSREDAAFRELKKNLCADTVLAHFQSSVPIGISCDASEVGIGAVLFPRYPDGSEQPIANIS